MLKFTVLLLLVQNERQPEVKKLLTGLSSRNLSVWRNGSLPRRKSYAGLFRFLKVKRWSTGQSHTEMPLCHGRPEDWPGRGDSGLVPSDPPSEHGWPVNSLQDSRASGP